MTFPSLPQNFMIHRGYDYINLSWQGPHYDGGTSITGNNLYRGQNGGPETLLTTITDGLWYNDTNVVTGITYHYRLAAYNTKGEGASTLSDNVSLMVKEDHADEIRPFSSLFENELFLLLAPIIILIIIIMVVISKAKSKKGHHQTISPTHSTAPLEPMLVPVSTQVPPTSGQTAYDNTPSVESEAQPTPEEKMTITFPKCSQNFDANKNADMITCPHCGVSGKMG